MRQHICKSRSTRHSVAGQRSRARPPLVSIAIAVFALTTALGHAHGQAATNGLTLRALFDSVRASHPAIRAANSRVNSAQGSRMTARAFSNPVLSYQLDQAPFPGGNPVNLEREATTTLTFPLAGLYQRGPRVSRANAAVRAATADAAATRQQIALAAADAFYRVALAHVQVATMRDVSQWLDTLVSYNRSRVDEGVAAEADLIRTELERDRVSAEVSLAEAELAQARAGLSAFLPNGDHTPAPLASLDASPLPFPTAAPATSIDARPDVRAARERVTAADAVNSAERLMIIPELDVTIGSMRTGPTRSMAAGLSIPLPAFNTNRGEIRRAAADRDVALFELAALERTARAELEGATLAARILTERTTAMARPGSDGFLPRADEARRIALGTYREGAIPLFQVIDATRAWADARTTYYKTLIGQHRAVLTLLAAAGADLLTATLRPSGDASR